MSSNRCQHLLMFILLFTCAVLLYLIKIVTVTVIEIDFHDIIQLLLIVLYLNGVFSDIYFIPS